MKTQYLIITFVCTFLSISSFAQKLSQDTIHVNGNCSSCKKHIETAATTAGASYAKWDVDAKLLVVKYDAGKTSNKKIQEKIAAAGYDTQDMKAPDAAYKKLDECCQYDRDKAPAKH